MEILVLQGVSMPLFGELTRRIGKVINSVGGFFTANF
jgi:hypothetical protein